LIVLFIVLSLIGLLLISKKGDNPFETLKKNIGKFTEILKLKHKVFEIYLETDKSVIPNHKLNLKSSQLSGTLVYNQIKIDKKNIAVKENSKVSFRTPEFTGTVMIDEVFILTVLGKVFGIELNDFSFSTEENKSLEVLLQGIPYDFKITNINQDLSFKGSSGKLRIGGMKTVVELNDDTVYLGRFKGDMILTVNNSLILKGSVESLKVSGEEVSINVR